MTPPLGQIRVYSTDPVRSVTCWLGPDRPDVTSGYGGWDEIVRPRRPPITTWKAPPALHMSLSLLLDNWATGVSIEDQVAALEDMAKPTARDGEPPLVRFQAKGNAVPHQRSVWVIGELTWGDALMNEDGNRVRQQVTLTLYEYVGDVYLTETSAAQKRRIEAVQTSGVRQAEAKIIASAASLTAPTVLPPPVAALRDVYAQITQSFLSKPTKAKPTKPKPGASARRTTSKTTRAKTDDHSRSLAPGFGSGEDLLSLAARELGDADRWVEIAALNNIRDPRSIALGQVLRLP